MLKYAVTDLIILEINGKEHEVLMVFDSQEEADEYFGEEVNTFPIWSQTHMS